jgi:preprotein translocase subunit Sss1
MSSADKKDKGVIAELQDFFKASNTFMRNCQKPDAKGK